jgi:hypothetical protein
VIRKLGIATLGVLIGGGFYLLLIDTSSPPELYVLAGVALACGLFFLVSREQGFTEARVTPLQFRSVWRLALTIPVDIALVCREAVAQLIHPLPGRGSFRTVAFRAVEETPEATARRAMAEVLGSVAPNTIVLGVDADRRLLLVHQLHRQGPPEDLDVLRLG